MYRIWKCRFDFFIAFGWGLWKFLFLDHFVVFLIFFLGERVEFLGNQQMRSFGEEYGDEGWIFGV